MKKGQVLFISFLAVCWANSVRKRKSEREVVIVVARRDRRAPSHFEGTYSTITSLST